MRDDDLRVKKQALCLEASKMVRSTIRNLCGQLIQSDDSIYFLNIYIKAIVRKGIIQLDPSNMFWLREELTKMLRKHMRSTSTFNSL